MTPVIKKPSLSILLFLTSFPAVLSTVFVPALPEISREFHISIASTQTMVTIYLIGVAVGQLIYGALSNRYGRKRAIYSGIFLAIGGIIISIVAYFTHTYSLLLAGRMITALGASMGMVMNFILIHDSFSDVKAREVISYTLMLSSLMPGLAAAIGGYLIEVFNWKVILYFLLLYSCALSLLCFWLPETCAVYDRQAMNLHNIFRGYQQQLTRYRLIFGSLIMGGNTAIIYIFSSVSPFIVIKHMGQSPELYGQLMLIPSFGLLLGALISAKLSGITKTKNAITLGLIILLMSSIFMFIAFKYLTPSLWNLFASMFFIFLGIAICYSNTSIITLGFASNSSNGSSVISFINSATSMIGVAIIQSLNLTKTELLPAILLSIITSMILLYLFLGYASRLTPSIEQEKPSRAEPSPRKYVE